MNKIFLCLGLTLFDLQAAEICDVRDLHPEALVRAFHCIDKPRIVRQARLMSDGEVDSLVGSIRRSAQFVWNHSYGQAIRVTFFGGGNQIDVSGYNQEYGVGSAQRMLDLLRSYFRVHRMKTSRH